MLVTENVTVNDAADAGDRPAAVWTITGPVVVPGGTVTLRDVAVTFVGTAEEPPVKSTRSAPKSPLPAIVITIPVEPLAGVKELTRGSIVKFPVDDVPPAFVTEMGPDWAAGGTVTFRLVPPTPIADVAETRPLDLADVVPMKVLPAIVTFPPAIPSFDNGPEELVRRPFNVAVRADV